ncbi:MAG: EAL domain-containing protein [Rhodocyclaceae bacterium]|nr:EAL domain-containing protein [Rhodocyclaceae bacterium]
MHMWRQHFHLHAKHYALAVAVVVGTLGLGAGLGVVGQQTIRQANLRIDAAEAELSTVSRELDRAFERLGQTNSAEMCTPGGLIKLRAMLLDFRYIRDIGIYDREGRLFCTSSMGALPKAQFDPAASLINQEGRLYWLDMPLIMSDRQIKATVIRDGAFNVVLDPFISQALLKHRDIDAIWFVMGRRITRLSAPDANDFDLEQAMLNAVRQASLDADVQFVAGRFIVTRGLAESEFVVQIVRAPAAMVAGHVAYLVLLIIGALALGALAYYLLLERMRRANDLKYRIRRLLVERNLVCLYQPIVDLTSGNVTGCEVLMRLRNDERLISPDEAIPAILARGLAWELDRLISAKAVTELLAALPPGPSFKLAFNFFPENLAHRDFRAHLDRLRELAGKRLQLNIEVTEYSFVPESIDTLHQLRDDGYLVSVDDFGTGYSNLGTVKRVGPDFLKIDKSFVFEMEDASLRSNLIPEIVAIARAVGAEVIGEGVENLAQAQSLHELGVRYGQGYYFARPMAADALCIWMQERTITKPNVSKRRDIRRVA